MPAGKPEAPGAEMAQSGDAALLTSHQEAFEHRHRPDLDGIRGILATCVVLLHFGINSFVTRLTHGAATGFVFALSVDVFFLLSGFVLTAAQAKATRHDLPKFVIKRLLRLLPVFYAATAIVLINAGPDYDYRLAPLELLLGLPFVGRDPANFPAWSITWELYLPIAAYALAPFLPKRPSWHPLLLVAALAGLALADVAVAMGDRYYFARAVLGLAGGHLLFHALPLIRLVWRQWHTYLLLALLFAVMLAASAVPMVAAATPLIACALILSGAANDSPLLSSRPVQFLGAVSYTIYLAHIPVLRLFQLLLGQAIDSNPPLKLLGIAVSFLLAWLLTRYVELPMMRLSRRWVEASQRKAKS